MKFATWNVNSLNVRLNHVLKWLAANPVDILCLQELKQTDDKFPEAELRDAGYHSFWAGQPTYNGVAILSKQPLSNYQRNIPGFEDPQQRIVAGTISTPKQQDIRIISAYCPNGQSVGSDKYEYKLQWYAALTAWLKQELAQHQNLLILGDFNIAPADIDVHDPEAWQGSILVSEQERQAFNKLIDLGLVDTFRLLNRDEQLFSWWDYRRMSFRRNAGVRIDHVLATAQLADICTTSVIDKEPRKWEKPSDHTPVISSFALK